MACASQAPTLCTSLRGTTGECAGARTAGSGSFVRAGLRGFASRGLIDDDQHVCVRWRGRRFDGDGFVHAVHLDAETQSANYSGTHVQTSKFKVCVCVVTKFAYAQLPPPFSADPAPSSMLLSLSLSPSARGGSGARALHQIWRL
jgi:hypothetical protein